MMRGPDKRSGVGRALGVLFALSMACGGLAESGPSPPALASEDPELNPARDSSPRRAAPSGKGVATGEKEEAGRRALPAASRVGEACGPLGGEASKSAVVGEVELQEDARCGVSNSCLMRAPAVDACQNGSGVADCARVVDEFVPVPPWVAAEPDWEEGTCTCRCDGSAPNGDYCACPAGMRCAELIPSAGVNAAARAYVGSYCVF